MSHSGRRTAPRSLRDRRDFARVYAEGEKRVGRLLVLYTLPAADEARAVVASRKIGKAVRRNRAKRLLREALRSVLGNGAPPGSGQGTWIVAVARREIVDARFPDVRRDLEALTCRTGPA